MKFKITVLTFLCGLFMVAGPLTSSAQSLHVYYKKQIVPNTENIPRWFRSGSQKQQYIRSLEDQANNERNYYSLYTDGRNAEFVYDTTLVVKKKEERGWGWFRGNPENNYYWHTNIKAGTSTKHSTDLDSEVCSGIEVRKEFKWQMGKGKKVFSDILCNKAYTVDEKGDSTIAWFARTLPISSGPQEYGGLPGMILALETKSFIYIAEEVEKIDRDIPRFEKDLSNCIDEDEFNDKAWRAFMEKMMKND